MSVASSEPQPTQLRFICCTQSYAPGSVPTTFDEEGFVVCPEHGQRRYGWKSPRRTPFVIVPYSLDERGEKRTHDQVNWNETPLERDRAVVGDLFPGLTDAAVLAMEEEFAAL